MTNLKKGETSDLSVFIPTFNEEIHIERALKSAFSLTDNVYVIDSYSTDRTVEIAQKYGAQVYYYKWEADSNWAKKFNWTLENVPFQTEWIMRHDADEYVTDELRVKVIADLDKLDKNISAIAINRREYFMRRWMQHGGAYPKHTVRIFRLGKAHFEARIIDEHVEITEGSPVYWNVDTCDDKIISLTKWIANHNIHALKEALILIDNEIGLSEVSDDKKALDNDALKKRHKKMFYGRLPYFWRVWMFFVYRYLFKGGFLDGVEGFLYCFFQCLWYRTLADAKIVETYRKCGKNPEAIKKYFLEEYNIKY